jgi:zinc transporter ZupT
MTLHKFPAALALSSLLVKGKEYTKKKILLSMFIFALATPVGALVAVFISQGVDDYVVATALGIFAAASAVLSQIRPHPHCHAWANTRAWLRHAAC